MAAFTNPQAFTPPLRAMVMSWKYLWTLTLLPVLPLVPLGCGPAGAPSEKMNSPFKFD
jgi:hypothetical protein